jgi:hypothetical protein
MPNISENLRISILAFALLGTVSASAQQDPIHIHWGESGEKLSSLISADRLKNHVYTLASTEFQGRETGSPGIDKASAYISDMLRQYGVSPLPGKKDYYQNVAFTWVSWEEASLYVGEERYKHLWDFISFPAQNSDMAMERFNEIVYVGYGIEEPGYNEYKGLDLRGKVVLMYKGEPQKKNGQYLLSMSTKPSKWNQNLQLKLETAAAHGARMVLFIEDEIKKILNENRNQLIMPKVILGKPDELPAPLINSAQISTNLARVIMGEQFKNLVKIRDKGIAKGKPAHLILKTNFSADLRRKVSQLDGRNILAYIPGDDPQLQDELLVVSAHYDHLGMKGDNIFHGADDNASGSSGILELARIFQEAKRLGIGARRSVLFIWVTGEEKGLLGSKYYVENPVFPLEKTIANINIDMIGRQDKNYPDNPNYIYVIGADKMSTELHAINETQNSRYTKLTLDYRYNDEKDPNRFYYRSDHYNFVEKGIPAVFYFSGVHDDYHRTTDTADKLDYDKMAVISQLAFHVAWELTNRDKRIKVDVKP